MNFTLNNSYLKKFSIYTKCRKKINQVTTNELNQQFIYILKKSKNLTALCRQKKIDSYFNESHGAVNMSNYTLLGL